MTRRKDNLYRWPNFDTNPSEVVAQNFATVPASLAVFGVVRLHYKMSSFHRNIWNIMATSQIILVSRLYPMSHVSRYSSVIIVNGYGLDDWGQISSRDRHILLPFLLQMKSGAHSFLYLKNRVGCFSGNEVTGVPRMQFRGAICLHWHLYTSS